MSAYVIHEKTIKKARKDHHCDASEVIRDNYRDCLEMVNAEEKAQIEAAKENKWAILKGNSYIRQFLKQDGQAFYYKAIPEMHAIAIKYDLYVD